MICYRDRTFCVNPRCTCPEDRRLTDEHEEAARELGLPVACGDLCGEVKP